MHVGSRFFMNLCTQSWRDKEHQFLKFWIVQRTWDAQNSQCNMCIAFEMFARLKLIFKHIKHTSLLQTICCQDVCLSRRIVLIVDVRWRRQMLYNSHICYVRSQFLFFAFCALVATRRFAEPMLLLVSSVPACPRGFEQHCINVFNQHFHLGLWALDHMS